MYFKVVIASFLFLCGISRGFSQIYLKGKVESINGGPVSFATVKWKKDTTGIVIGFTITDSSGNYKLVLRENEGWIQVSAIGYQSIIKPVPSHSQEALNFVLSPHLSELTPILIKNKPSIEVSGDTISYQTDRFKRGNETNLKQLLLNIPGFSVSRSGLVSYNGKPLNRVMLNGDDLSGRNYQNIINNLDVVGIDRIEVIQEFKDPDDLAASFSPNHEQVLNLVYKKGFLSRIFGNAEGATGTPLLTHNGAFQTIGLFQKLKMISLNKGNSMGRTSVSLSQDESLEQNRTEGTYDFEFWKHDPFASIQTMNTGIKNLDALYRNQTYLSSTQFILRPNRKLSLRGRVNYNWDRFYQQVDNTTTYFVGSTPFEIRQGTNSRFMIRKLDAFISLNFIPSSKQQLIVTAKRAVHRTQVFANSFEGVSHFNEESSSIPEATGIKLIFNRMLPKDKAITGSFQYQEGKNPLNYSVTPPVFLKFFNQSSTSNLLLQNEEQLWKASTASIRYFKKHRKLTTIIELNGKYSSEGLANSIKFVSSSGETEVNADSVNKAIQTFSSIGATIQSFWKANPKLTLGILGTAIYFKSQMEQSRNILEGWRMLPGLQANYRLSDKSTLIFSDQFGNRLTDVRNTAGGFIINGLTALSKGYDTLQSGFIHTSQLSYSHINLVQKRFLFFASVVYIQQPIFRVPLISSQGTFTFSKYLPSQFKNSTVSFILNSQFLSSDYKTKLAPLIRITEGSTYRYNNFLLQKSRFQQASFGADFNMEVKSIQIKSKIGYTITRLADKSPIINQEGEAMVGMNVKLSKRVFVDAESSYYTLKPYEQRSSSLFISNLNIVCKSTNDKWSYGVGGNNLFGKQLYSTAMLTSTIATVVDYRLFPRTILVFIKYRF